METYTLKFKPDKVLCVSDLDTFYQLDPHLKQAVLFKRPKPSAYSLAQVVLREKTQAQSWLELTACYLRKSL